MVLDNVFFFAAFAFVRVYHLKSFFLIFAIQTLSAKPSTVVVIILPFRIGHGFDVHKFGDGNHIVLGGVVIPYSQGLIAHSDGDVALHALTDALLGAAALGDIGKHFPDTDAAFAGADRRVLLNRT